VWFGPFVAAVYGHLWQFLLGFWPEALAATSKLFFFGTSLFLLLICVKAAGARLRHFRYFWQYPPLLVSALLAWTLLLVLFPLVATTAVPDARTARVFGIATALVWVAIAIVLPLFFSLRGRHAQSTQSAPAKSRDDLRKFSIVELIEWLSDERPIELPAEDYFGAENRASQVWEALQKRRSSASSKGLMQTVVVEGRFGSGKTSLVRLLERHVKAEQPDRFILVRISAWGFSSSAVRQYILERAIEELARWVDCRALRGMPQAYVDALSQCAKWLPALLSPWLSDAEPVKQLRLLTPILRAINAHLVVVIEDSDRTASDFDPQHLQAMLNDFREVEGLSFVLTVGSTAQIDFPKLAEQIIMIPSVPPTDAAMFLDRIRNHCREKWPVIDLVTTEQNRPTSLFADLEAANLSAFLLPWRISAWSGAIADVVTTPRDLKFALSAILRSWDGLHGEVDLDELIMMTVLRHAAGPAFSFLVRRSVDLRLLSSRFHASEGESEKKQREENIQALKNEWRRAVADSRADESALDVLICNLFPAAFAITRRRDWNQANRVQSVNSDRSEVYLERITSGNVSRDAVRDQDVLEALSTIAGNKNLQTFSDRFTTSREFAEIVIFFDKTRLIPISQTQRLKVSSLLIKDLSRKAGAGRIENSPVHDLFSHWQSPAEQDTPEFRNWAAEQIIGFIPHNLLHATELYFDFVRDTHLPLEAQSEIRQRMVQSTKEQLSKLTPKEFAQCFPAGFPYTLGHLIRLDRKDYPPPFLTKHTDWVWMTPLLLSAIQIHPEILIPQIINEFGEYGPGGELYTWYRFREDAVKEFFGDRAHEFYSAIRQPFDVDRKMDANFARLVSLAQEKANEKSNPPEVG
jgi:hypothetical protein